MKLCNSRNKINKLFEGKYINPSDYPHNAEYVSEEFEEEFEEPEPEKFEESITERTKMRREKQSGEKYTVNDFNKIIIIEKDKSINKNLSKKHCAFQSLSDIQKQFHRTKNKEKSKKLVQLIDSRMGNLENEIKKMSEDEIKTEKPYEILNIVEKILTFNREEHGGQGQD